MNSDPFIYYRHISKNPDLARIRWHTQIRITQEKLIQKTVYKGVGRGSVVARNS